MRTKALHSRKGANLSNRFKLYNIICFSLLATIVMLTSCRKKVIDEIEEKEVVKEEVVKEVVKESSTLEFKSNEILEFKQINSDIKKTFPSKDISQHFGRRVELSTPLKVIFTNDSLTIIKPYGIEEKYKTKWQNDELFILGENDEWRYCGKKRDKENFILNTGFYCNKSENKQRSFVVLGQDYSLKTESELISGKETMTTWLRVQYLFEK